MNNTNEILQARRQAVMDAMRKMATIRWSIDVDTPYSLRLDSDDVQVDLKEYPERVIMLKAGQIYQGIPYTHGLGSYYSFSDYLSDEPDENGVYKLTVDSAPLNGGFQTCRVGNACSGAVMTAWAHVASSFIPDKTMYMTPSKNYLPVGSYKRKPERNFNTAMECEENGTKVMYEAYAQLQMSDAVVHYRGETFGHIMMVAEIHVNRDAEGNVLEDSYILAIHQTRSKIRCVGDDKLSGAFVDEVTGQKIQPFYGMNDKLTFKELYESGYFPITCKELIDPAPVEAFTVTDTETTHDMSTIFTGSFETKALIHSVAITITNENGEKVQACTAYAWRDVMRSFPLCRFLEDAPEILNGKLDLDALAAGKYRCTHVAQISNGTEFTVRDFDFTVE